MRSSPFVLRRDCSWLADSVLLRRGTPHCAAADALSEGPDGTDVDAAAARVVDHGFQGGPGCRVDTGEKGGADRPEQAAALDRLAQLREPGVADMRCVGRC